MSQDTNDHAIAPTLAKGWLTAARLHARPIRNWIGQASKGAASQDWTTPKSSRSSRRPVWE